MTTPRRRGGGGDKRGGNALVMLEVCNRFERRVSEDTSDTGRGTVCVCSSLNIATSCMTLRLRVQGGPRCLVRVQSDFMYTLCTRSGRLVVLSKATGGERINNLLKWQTSKVSTVEKVSNALYFTLLDLNPIFELALLVVSKKKISRPPRGALQLRCTYVNPTEAYSKGTHHATGGV